MKKSGFAVKITAFIEADPFDPASLTKALNAIGDIDPQLRLAGFVNRDVAYTVRQRVEVPTPIAPDDRIIASGDGLDRRPK